MSYLTTRGWRDGDDIKLLELFSDPASPVQHVDRTMLGPDTETPFGRGVVVEDEGVPVAAGALRFQAVHPARLWCYIETAESQRGRGIGTGILHELLRMAKEHDPSLGLKARSVTADKPTEKFLTAHGFTRINSSRRVLLAANSLPRPQLSEDGHGGYVLEELATGSTELSQVVAEFYVRVHQEWDPADISLTKAQQLLLAPPTGAVGAVVLRDKPRTAGGKILAFAISYQVHTAVETDVAPVAEVLFGHNPAAVADQEATATVSALVAMVTASGPVIVEVDEAHTSLTPIVTAMLDAGTATVETSSVIWGNDI